MSVISRSGVRLLCALLTAFALSACAAGQEYTYQDPTEDIMGSQPGLLSGEKGYFEYTIKRPQQ